MLALTEYKMTVQSTAVSQLDALDAKLFEVQKRIDAALESGYDINLPFDSPGRAPASDRKNFGKKRSLSARKRSQTRSKARFSESPDKFLGDLSTPKK